MKGDSVFTYEDREDNQEPYLHVQDQFLQVSPLEMPILNPSLIDSNPLNCEFFLLIGQPGDGHGVIRYEECSQKSNEDGEDA